MSFPAYERYKDSGIDWCAELPASWAVRRLRTLVEIRKRIAGSEGFDVLSITQRGIKVRDVESNDGQLAESYAHYQFVEPGDFAMNQMDLVTGWIDISDRRGVTSPDYRVFAVHDHAQVYPRYLLRVLQNSYSSKVFYAYGKGASHLGRWRLPTDAFQEFTVPLPSMAEQRAIAAFLDRETAKIDALVDAQRRLIELLKEKRQAVISHAVTRGLDSFVPMKDSGVELLGKMPAHWEVTRVKYAASHVVDCLHTTPTYDGELEFPAVRTADVERGRLLLDGARLVSREIYEERIQRLRPETDDILYTREGERFGLAALVPPGADLCLGQRMMMIRIAPGYDPAYVMWVLNSDPVYQQVVSGITGATAPHVNISEVINFHLPVPPLVEQQAIAAHILVSTSALDRLAEEAEAATLLLQERRAALISAAVIGKIDVQSQKPVAVADRDRVRLLVAAAVVERLAHRQNFGRVKLQKLIYLAETHTGIGELNGSYLRAAAGPLDRAMIEQMEASLEQSGRFAVRQVDGRGGQVSYRVLEAAGAFRDEARSVLKEREAKLADLIDTFADLDTKSTEAVATLYAAWNDLLQDGTVVSDDVVVSEVLTNWHPEKAQKFKKAELVTWLQWMRRRGLTPRGAGPRTTTGRLFV